MSFVEDYKKSVAFHHEHGFKTLLIGQAMAGGTTSITKATYASCINLFSCNALLDLFLNKKIVANIRILGDFPIDANRNKFVEEALEAGADYIFLMDMDQTFPGDALAKLFEVLSDQRPVVSGMYFLKKEPYSPVMGRYVEWDDEMLAYKEKFDRLGFVHPDGRQLAMWRAFTYFDKTVPFRADVIGLGCVLMQTSVFKDLEKPYFRYVPGVTPSMKHKTMDEVMHLCAQFAKHDIPIYIDPRVQCGHITQIESNIEIFESYRDSQFAVSAREKPEKFAEIQNKFIDVREEQRRGSRIEQVSAV